MNPRSKTAITVFLVIAVLGAVYLQIKNPNLFLGQIFNNEEGTNDSATTEPLPDLGVALAVIPPSTANGDITADITITNNGPGRIRGDKTFKYTVYLNETEVFSNSDSYTFMEPGDSFNFKYPISRQIYQYSNAGTVRAVVDSEDTIEEISEDNNEAVISY